MTKEIKDIVGTVISNIDKTIRISQIVDFDQPIVTLYLCSEVKWLRVGDVLINETGEFGEVIEITSEYIRVDKSSVFDWTNKQPEIQTTFHYFYGTKTAVNQQWLETNIDEDNKLPLIYLVLPVTESFEPRSSGLERETEILLYFCDRFDEYVTETQIIDNVHPLLQAYFDGFLSAVRLDYSFAELDKPYRSRKLPVFGNETSDGFDSLIMDSRLSALEVRITLPIRKGAQICKC